MPAAGLKQSERNQQGREHPINKVRLTVGTARIGWDSLRQFDF